MDNTIRFMLDGELHELDDVDPTRTVLQFLREDLGRTGTKEGCAEGDCGACTVNVLEIADDGIAIHPVNACIQFLPTLDGKELITVESLSRDGELHPVQRAMVEHHGSQCGFCTPGFVMSLFALYKNAAAPTRRDIDDALAGNLCRCTGYRPIIAAAQAMYDHDPDDDWLRQPATDGEHTAPAARVDALRKLQRQRGLQLRYGNKLFLAPRTSDELSGLVAQYPDATILAGGTDVGLWVTKEHRHLDTVIFTGNVDELRQVRTTGTHIEIGAAAALADAMVAIVDNYPGLDELFRRFASPPIRNAATLGGNIANGSPIGDSMPALIALGSTLVLRRGRSRREIPLEAFYLDYQVTDLREAEFIETIRLPILGDDVLVRSQKWSKRFDQDISAVCNAYRLELDGDRVVNFRMACGGMAATVKRAVNCEQAVNAHSWDEKTVEAACAALERDFDPISDMRASADARMRAAQNLLRRFYRETCGDLDSTVYTYGRA